jgi:putative hydroxymethylpyrimidine transport system substrate-binding protein
VRRTITSLAAALLAAAALGACGVKQEAVVANPPAKPFTVVLDRAPNATDAALYVASADGAFRAGGLAVALRAPAAPGEPLRLLSEGKADIAIVSEPELLLARDHGTALVAIAALVQEPLASVIALPRGHVASVADLAGKRVGSDGEESEEGLLRAMLAHAGVRAGSVRHVGVGFDYVPALLNGGADATFGGFWNYDAVALAQMGRHPTVIPASHAGVPSYDELVLAVRARQAEHGGEDLRAFLQALTQGQAQVKADPRGAVAVLVKANPGLSPKLELASLERTLPVSYPSGAGQPFGYQEPATWAAFARWMYAERMLHTAPATLAAPFTNEFLPGQGTAP